VVLVALVVPAALAVPVVPVEIAQVEDRTGQAAATTSTAATP